VRAPGLDAPALIPARKPTGVDHAAFRVTGRSPALVVVDGRTWVAPTARACADTPETGTRGAPCTEEPGVTVCAAAVTVTATGPEAGPGLESGTGDGADPGCGDAVPAAGVAGARGGVTIGAAAGPGAGSGTGAGLVDGGGGAACGGRSVAGST
jgi:hypothetical protein